MNSTHSSKTTTALVFLAVVLAAVGTASALTVSVDGLPEESAVGEAVTVTYTIEDPFTDAPPEYTLDGDTDLEDVRWTVTVKRAGSQLSEETYTDQSFSHDLDVDDDGDEVVVTLDGTTPAIQNYTYSPPESYRVASLDQRTGDNTEELVNDSAHHYTNQSKEARENIDDAKAAIDSAGGHAEAQELVDSAISSYEAENFNNTNTLANQAERKATNARQTTDTLTIAAAIFLAIGLVGGGYYLLRSGDDDYSKL